MSLMIEGMMQEHCGVIGILSFNEQNIVSMLIIGLEALQHRGQESWGISIPGASPFKRAGIISQSIEKEEKTSVGLREPLG